MKRRNWIIGAAAVAGGGWLFAQTAVNLSVQSRNVDFSAASYTKPMKTGTSLPASCTTGEMYFRTDAAPGQNVYGCTASNVWTQVSGAGGGGGGAATAVSQLTDFQIARTNNTTLTINGACSGANPCNFRNGSVVARFTAPATAALTSSTGVVTVYFYLTPDGMLTAGHGTGVTLSCTGCVTEQGITAFPAESTPLHTWVAGSPSGQWASAGSDYRSMLSGLEVSAGTGLSRVANPASGTVTLSVDPVAVALRVAVPASAGSSCSTGQWALNATHVYFCAAANTWRRAALSSW